VLHDPGSQSIDGPSTVVVVVVDDDDDDDDDDESATEPSDASPAFPPQAPRTTEHKTIEMIDELNFVNMIPPTA
jgi:hypothetical protein